MEKILETQDSLIYRCQCRCLSPDHAEDIVLELEELKPQVVLAGKYVQHSWRDWPRRLRDAWTIIRGKEVLMDEFTFREEDLRPVGEFLLKVASDYDKWEHHRVTEKVKT